MKEYVCSVGGAGLLRTEEGSTTGCPFKPSGWGIAAPRAEETGMGSPAPPRAEETDMGSPAPLRAEEIGVGSPAALSRARGGAEVLIWERANFPPGFDEAPTPTSLLILFANGCPTTSAP